MVGAPLAHQDAGAIKKNDASCSIKTTSAGTRFFPLSSVGVIF
jgi:hypothetical protein